MVCSFLGNAGLPCRLTYEPLADGESRCAGLWTRAGAMAIGWVKSIPWQVTAQFWLAAPSGLLGMDQDDRLRWRWNKPMSGSDV